MRDITLEDTFKFDFTTRAFGTGIPTSLLGSPVLSVHEEGNDAFITAGVSVDIDIGSSAVFVTGMHEGTIIATAANGYETGKSYSVFVSTGTVDSVSAIGEVIYEFTIGLSTANIQSRLPAALVTGRMDSNIAAISDDSVAADNLEATYDGTGYSNDVAPATQAAVGNIGSASGGAINFQTTHDNVITDTIDAAPAVDKGGGLVGIPVTGHAFTTGKEITIAGSINYNNSYDIVSDTANEIVITETYNAETFGGSETIVSSIKTVAFVGVQTTNTFAATEAEDGVYHVIDDVGNEIDIIYEFNIGGARKGVEITVKGYLLNNNDVLNLQTYDFVGSDWETRDILVGQNAALNLTRVIKLLSKHTGTGSDLGKVFIRFHGAAQSSPTLNIDEFLVAAVNIGQSVGYSNGQIWVDTINGVAGTEPFVNGVGDNPTNLIASAKTLSTVIGIPDFHIINGSAITLAESTVNESYFGDNWALALGSQDINGAYFQGASVSGIGTSATEVHFEGSDVATISVQKAHFDFCSFNGTVTHTLAGDYKYHNCYSNIAGSGSPVFSKTAGQVITAEWRNWMDSITVSGLEAGDIITINGRLGTVTLNGADATVEIRGSYKTIVNNLTGAPTVNIDGAWKGSDINDTLTNLTTHDNKIGTISDLGAGATVGDNLADMAGGTFSSTTDALESIRDRGDAAWITGGGGSISDILNVKPVIPFTIDLADTATVRIGLMLTNALDDLPSTAEITPGTIDIDRKAIGGTSWSNILSGQACSEQAGMIYFDEVFDSGTGYAEGDSIRFTFKSQKITVSANDYEITDANGVIFQTSIRQTMVGTDGALTDKTGFSLSSTGLDAISQAATGMVEIAKAIWDRVLTGATHNITNSAGKRLRDITSPVIRSNTAQGPGTGNNQIQLDTGASAVDNTYDPSVVCIVEGTGLGQSRLVIEYDGTTKTATVDKDWRVNPDATSSFVIICDPGRVHVNEGLAQAGTSTTITLNTLASSGTDIYRGQSCYIRSGTGQDQVKLILAYNGTTKVATIDGSFNTTPDTTSGYVILPISPILLSELTQASIDAIEADTNELQTDNVPGLIAALNDLSSANVLTQVNIALDTAISELAVAAPTATPTVRTSLMLLYMALRNRLDIDTGTATKEIFNDAGTKITSKALTDDSTTYSEGKMT